MSRREALYFIPACCMVSSMTLQPYEMTDNTCIQRHDWLHFRTEIINGIKYLNEKKLLQFVNMYPSIMYVHFLRGNVALIQTGQADSVIFHDLSFLYILM
jgi:hypothetical protein